MINGQSHFDELVKKKVITSQRKIERLQQVKEMIVQLFVN